MTRDEAFRNLRKKSRLFKRIFGSSEGQEVLQALSDEFDTIDIMADTPERTAYNLGRRDVVMYINQLIDANLGEEQRDE